MIRHRRPPAEGRRTRLSLTLRRVLALGAAAGATLALPASVSAHELTERYQAPLPLAAYVAGAAVAVAMSFAFVALRTARHAPEGQAADRSSRMPLWAQLVLRTLGLIAWLWIVVQAVIGGASEADVASLFIWVYGWVGVALVSALVGPLWSWLDPFSTLHMLLGGVGRRLGLSGGESAPYPAALDIWPAVVGFGFVVWLELVARVEGGRTLGLVVVGYTVLTLAAMSYFGRETWRRHGEIFSVWFGVLGRLAPFALDGRPEEGRLVRRPFAAGLRGGWSLPEVVLVTLGTGSIIFDGLSQTEIYFELFIRSGVAGLSPVIVDTIVAVVFFGVLIGLVLLTARMLGLAALGAGLLPVAVGYLVAHYLVFLLVDGQRILHALNDPLQRGDNLLPFDVGFHEPQLFLPTAVVWSIQLAAVVGGHIVGAWAGHAALERGPERAPAVRQLPLAVLMVGLTTLTLWSLGQAVISEPETGISTAAATAGVSPPGGR